MAAASEPSPASADASANASADAPQPSEKAVPPEKYLFHIFDDNLACMGVVKIGNGSTNRQMNVQTLYKTSEQGLKRLTLPVVVYRALPANLPLTADMAWADMTLTVTDPRDASHYAFYHALRYFFDDLIARLPRTSDSGAYKFDVRRWREILTSRDLYQRPEAFLFLLPPLKDK